jgi:hypothetical protein
MKKVFLSAIFVFVFSLTNGQSSETFWMLGPMFHFNIGKQFDFSMGLEISAWGDFGSVDYGVDVYNKDRFFIYSEYQTAMEGPRGVYVYGVSLGPCIEVRTDSLPGVHLGVQASGWIPLLDMRVRWVKDDFRVSPGFFFKLPLNYPTQSGH